jgi:hypothetical protein
MPTYWTGWSRTRCSDGAAAPLTAVIALSWQDRPVQLPLVPTLAPLGPTPVPVPEA